MGNMKPGILLEDAAGSDSLEGSFSSWFIIRDNENRGTSPELGPPNHEQREPYEAAGLWEVVQDVIFDFDVDFVIEDDSGWAVCVPAFQLSLEPALVAAS